MTTAKVHLAIQCLNRGDPASLRSCAEIMSALPKHIAGAEHAGEEAVRLVTLILRHLLPRCMAVDTVRRESSWGLTIFGFLSLVAFVPEFKHKRSCRAEDGSVGVSELCRVVRDAEQACCVLMDELANARSVQEHSNEAFESTELPDSLDVESPLDSREQGALKLAAAFWPVLSLPRRFCAREAARRVTAEIADVLSADAGESGDGNGTEDSSINWILDLDAEEGLMTIRKESLARVSLAAAGCVYGRWWNRLVFRVFKAETALSFSSSLSSAPWSAVQYQAGEWFMDTFLKDSDIEAYQGYWTTVTGLLCARNEDFCHWKHSDKELRQSASEMVGRSSRARANDMVNESNGLLKRKKTNPLPQQGDIEDAYSDCTLRNFVAAAFEVALAVAAVVSCCGLQPRDATSSCVVLHHEETLLAKASTEQTHPRHAASGRGVSTGPALPKGVRIVFVGPSPNSWVVTRAGRMVRRPFEHVERDFMLSAKQAAVHLVLECGLAGKSNGSGGGMDPAEQHCPRC